MSPPIVYVSKAEISRIFNENGYAERVETGMLIIGEVVCSGPSPGNFPIGSMSQMVEYLTRDGKTVAWVHQDGDENGYPAEGSTPDPKFLFHNGIRYKPSEFPPSPPLRFTRPPSRLGKKRRRRRR